MTIRNYATRMSCFSLISAIETDLRDIIFKQFHITQSLELPQDVEKNAKERYREHNKLDYNGQENLRQLLDFIDFYDLSKIINKVAKNQTEFSADDIAFITTGLERLSQCRNRVCHSRPLEPSDFSDLLDYTNELKIKGREVNWRNISTAINNLDNPAFALGLTIPEFWKSSKRYIYNNLPIPEFDDIGFIGRDKDRTSICRLIESNTRVISIVGEGGIGKTALAQRCLYDILEICEDKNKEPPLFDIILWISLKTNRLTAAGVEQIHGAISSGTGLFRNLSSSLGGSETDSKSALKEIHDYMNDFKVLLCIDNLETISSNEVRDFLANIPQSSKVLITTRVGLGEIEYRYKLDKLDDNPSVQLMRSMSKLLNVGTIYKKNNASLIELCKKLFNNPLLIKWYVLSAAAGKNLAEITNHQGSNFKDALKFCFENLYDCLSDLEVDVISIIACWRKPISAVELRFVLSDTNDVAIEEALNQLHNSSMLESATDQSDSRIYSLTGVAAEYITSLKPATKKIFELVKQKKRELQSTIAQQTVHYNRYNYNLSSIYWSNRDEKICAIYLRQALTESRLGHIEKAAAHINIAKSMMPEFSECYRVNSFILRDSPFQAQSELELAIELNPNSSLTRYAYAQFALKEEDFYTAYEQIDEALKIDPEEVALKTCKAWICTLLGKYDIASKAYEEILPKLADRPKKFRLSTIDQASTCYLRWAEQKTKDGEFEIVKNCLNRLREIQSTGISAGDYDDQTIIKLCKLLPAGENYYTKTRDPSISINSLQTIDQTADFLSAPCLTRLKFELEKYSEHASPENKLKAQQILGRLNGPDSKFGTRIYGTVIRVVGSERGVSYGFIRGDDEVEYFFHRSYLRPHALLDGDNQNIHVSFAPGRSTKGLCAFDIEKTQ